MAQPEDEASVESRSPRARAAVEVVLGVAGIALLALAWHADRAFYGRHLTPVMCFTRKPEVDWFVAKRTMAVVLGLGALALARPIGRRVERRWRGGSGLLRSTFAVLMAILASDVVLRLRHYKIEEFPPVLARSDSRYGWALVESSTWTHAEEQVLSYVVARDGHRSRSDDDVVDPTRPTIVVGGESTGLGWKLPYDESFAYLLGTHLDVQVVNTSVNAYAADQVYLNVTDELGRLQRPIAVVTLVLAQTVARVTRPWTSHLTVEPDGAFGVAPAWPRIWSTSPVRKMFVDSLPWHGDEEILVTRAVVRKTAEAARARGAFPLFVWTNYMDACLPDEKGTPPLYRDIFHDLDVPHILVEMTEEDRLAGDGHASPVGHGRLAAAIEVALREAGIPGRRALRR